MPFSVIVVMMPVAAPFSMPVVMIPVAASLSMLMVVLMMPVAASLSMLMVMPMMLLLPSHILQQFLLPVGLLFHRAQHLRPVHLFPWGRNNSRLRILRPDEIQTGPEFVFGYLSRAAQDDRTRVFDLVVVKFAEIFHIHLTFCGVRYRHKTVQPDRILWKPFLHAAHGLDHIRKFPHAGRLNDNAVGRIFLQHFTERRSKVPDEGTADTAGVHFRNIDPRIFQKSAVDPDLTKFIFDQHQFLTLKRLLDQFLDQRRLPGSQKTGYNINFCHVSHSPFLIPLHIFKMLIIFGVFPVPTPGKPVFFKYFVDLVSLVDHVIPVLAAALRYFPLFVAPAI